MGDLPVDPVVSETRPATTELPKLCVGPYRLIERLGAGGMGEVFRAFDERLEREVALKQVRAEVSSDSQAWRRFEREARAVARLRHPGIVEIHDLFTEDDGDWIVMELVEGRALSDLIDEGSLQPDQVLDIAIRLALALASAHAEGIVHRDLKARNVMLTDDGQPKILDFGLAKELRGQAEASAASITADGQVVGTPHAMSPEQAMGRKVDLRSDLFSLGSLLYELSTGLAPFAAESAMAMLHRVCTHRPAPVHERTSAYPRAFSELVAQLLEKDPGYRPANAAEVASRLERAAQRLARGEITGLRQSGVELVAERRQLTIVECLLVVEASGQPIADPVELAAVMEIFETVARQVFEELQGYVARCEGQRLEAYFGYPRAQEDAARRAIHAAQEMASRLGMANLEAGGTEAGVTETEVTASIRAGVHSGPAIVHPKGESLPVLGRTADIADALARVADVGEILVSDTVRRLVADAYAVEDSGQSLGETAVFRIGRGHGTSSFRFASTPLLARDTEIGLLVDRAARAQEGAGQVMLIHGEAGIGKSRLLAGLKGEMEPLAMDWLLAQASPIHKASPLQPVIAMVEGLIDDGPAEESGERQSTNPLADLEEILGKEARSSSIPLLASLLGLPVTTPYVLPDVTPQKQREMTLQALVDLVKSLAKRHALALVVEDLHWADPTTLDWLGRL
ncbi:MAG: protein kinase, partial [Acidobacteriota bacterium]